MPATRKTGNERFRLGGGELPLELIEFWSWASSDVLSNATRGVLAEFIVASAAGCADRIRVE